MVSILQGLKESPENVTRRWARSRQRQFRCARTEIASRQTRPLYTGIELGTHIGQSIVARLVLII